MPDPTTAITNPFTKLSADELDAAGSTVAPILTTLSTGDGSVPALAGAWLSLQGAFTTNLALFQKIGVNDLAAWLLATMNAGIAQAKATIASSTSGSAS